MERKRRGFTLVELLVVIAIIALLMGILMPALARVRMIAHRVVCGTSLKAIGSAMLVYANDNDEEYPRAWREDGRVPRWSTNGNIENWKGADADAAYGFGTATITTSLYLLIRSAEMQPKNFVCKGDAKVKIFKLRPKDKLNDVTEAWDFGEAGNDMVGPGEYCSYAYHMPYKSPTGGREHSITPTSKSGCPVCADRNPYLDTNAKVYVTDPDLKAPGLDSNGNYEDVDKKGNSACHQREGQNVLFQDSHVSFEKYPNVGIENDNIYKYWDRELKDFLGLSVEARRKLRQVGGLPGDNTMMNLGQAWPGDISDACLVGELNGVL